MFGLKEVLENRKIKLIVAESWSISWPMTLIMFLIFLIGLSDVFVAGKFGKDIQAAYGLAFQLYFILSIIANAITIGTVAVVSRLFTSSRKEEFGRTLYTTFIVSVITGIIFSFLGIVFSKYIVSLFDIPPSLKVVSTSLSIIYSSGLVFNYVLTNTNGILRACKMVRKSLLTMLIICILNVALNFLLAFRTPLGFKGIAVATVLSTFCGMLLNIFYVKKLSTGTFNFSRSIIQKILKISWPAGLLQIFWQLSAMALFYIISLLPQHNVEIIAAFTNGLKIESAIFLPAFAFNMANAVVVGNLLGKSDREDSFHGGIVTAFIGVVMVSIMTVLVLFNARHIMSLLSDNHFVISEGVRYVYISLIFEPLLAWGVILGGGLNGAGDTKSLMWIVVLSVWFVRIPLAYFLAVYQGLGAPAVWWSMNASIIIQTVFITKRYFSKKWLLV